MSLRTLSYLVATLFPLVPATASAQTTRPSDAQFVASSRGQVFYWVGCDGWKSLSKRNLRWFRSAAEAQGAGYRPSTARGCAPQLDTALIRPSVNGTAPCVVTRIIDGDTFQCEGGSRVRLLLVDADEAGQSVYADSAAFLLRRLMPPGSRVMLRFDVQLQDRYDRVLAYVQSDGVFVNRALARAGFAHVAIYPPNTARIDEIRAAVDTARAQKRGVWSGSAFQCRPADYRAGRCR